MLKILLYKCFYFAVTTKSYLNQLFKSAKMALKNHDFIELDYIAIDLNTNHIFDITSREQAKARGIYLEKAKYGPIIICIGERQIIKGLDNFLEGKELNKEYEVDITPEEAFGKKDPKLMKLLPLNIFKENNINPSPGLQINFDNLLGTIRTVSSGRVIVDFNHPLSGHNLRYILTINKLIKNDKTKVESILKHFTSDFKVTLKDEVVEIESGLTNQVQIPIKETIQRTIPTIKEIRFKIHHK